METQNNINNKRIWVAIGTIVFLVVVAVVPNLIGIFSINDPVKEFLALIFVCILYTGIITITSYVYNYFVEKRKDIDNTNITCENKCDKSHCIYHNNFCCGNAIIEKLKDTIDLSQKEKQKYRLLNESEFNSLEKDYFQSHSEGQIWVVSFALETEIEYPIETRITSLQKSMNIVKQNIKKGFKYVQFVALGESGLLNPDFIERKKIYHKDLSDVETKAPVIQIDDSNNKDNMMFMVKLTSVVLFIDKEGTENNKDYEVKGYFWFRPDEDSENEFEKRPVFFRMPNCMESQYFEFLRTKKINYFKNINKK
jgi:hypothetical protein